MNNGFIENYGIRKKFDDYKIFLHKYIEITEQTWFSTRFIYQSENFLCIKKTTNLNTLLLAELLQKLNSICEKLITDISKLKNEHH